MKKSRPAWKRYITTAAIAFLLGLLPYVILQISSATEGLTFCEYAASLWTFAGDFLSTYAPHIITLYVIGVAVMIFLEGQNPDRTILWLLTLALLPVVGVFLYLLMGPDMKRIQTRRLFKPLKSYPTIVTPQEDKVPPNIRKIAVLAYRSASAEILERGSVRILIDGEETFDCLKRELRAAKRYINIEYFIFQDDRLGNEIADILCERASAGVAVRMMTDGVGSWKLGRKLIKRLADSGVAYNTFMPVSFPALRSGINFRNHRKIVVIDGDLAFTGGLNVGDEYLGKGPLGNWRDTHALFCGDVVRQLNEIFLQDWKIACDEELSPDMDAFRPTDPSACDSMPFLPMQIVASGSSSAWHSIAQMYVAMIASAQTRIWITSPYLVPGASIMNALAVAALAGTDVRILIPAHSDHFLVFWGGRSNIEALLRAGVRIWMYRDGFVHAKTLLMDDAVASVGTANLDNRSLEINFEVQAFIYDRATCQAFEEQFLKDLQSADECLLHEWEQRGARARVLESLGRLWSSQI